MIEIILFVIGLFILIKGADFLVDGSSSLAKRFNIPSIIIGLTIVAFGTSFPELVVNILASLSGNSEMSFGNIVGSNIANILLILGATLLITKIKVKSPTVWKEIPFSLLAGVILLIFSSTFFLDGIHFDYIYRFEGLILLIFFALFLYYVFKSTIRSKSFKEESDIEIKELTTKKIVLYILIGVIGLYIGGTLTVDGAIFIARFFGLSEYLISLTVIAIGTSLPELITSINAARKKDVDLAVGNVVGSNIFNIFWVIGISAIINPIKIPLFGVSDLIVLLSTTLILFLFLFSNKLRELRRWHGIFFLIFYLAYLIYLIIR
jgi:cation:H+ antiporter